MIVMQWFPLVSLCEAGSADEAHCPLHSLRLFGASAPTSGASRVGASMPLGPDRRESPLQLIVDKERMQ